MDDHLGYSKYDYKNKETDDSRNGYSPKTVTSSMGTIDLDILLTLIGRQKQCFLGC